MAVRSGFFNSINGDRTYHTGHWAEYFASFIGNGVFPNPSSNLQVASNNNMTITIKPGKAWINGYILINDSDYQLSLSTADGVLNRIDRIVARYDTVARAITLEVKQGVFASNPVAPTLQRDADGYELAIADIRINAGVISITQANIIDTRLNSDLCGIVHGVVEQVDTTTIFDQYQSWINQEKQRFENDVDDWLENEQLDFETWEQQQKDDFDMWFSNIQDILDGNVAANLQNQIEQLQTDLSNIDAPTTESFNQLETKVNAHQADDVSQGEIHGFRLTDGKLEYFDGAEWQRVKGDGYPVGNVVDFTASVGNGEVTLKWGDPSNVTVEDSNGNVITIARWAGTKLLRKTGNFPVDESDGVLLVDNTTRNKYQTTGFKDTGRVNGTAYYYMLFPYTQEDVVTVDGANRATATPQAYDDLTGSPGPKNLIGGTMQAGFFGEVPASELFTASQIASACGITQGTAQHENEPWLKFAYEGKILFRPRKAIRHSISWDAINTAKCVYGDSDGKTVTKDGKQYRVRLMRGALTDPSKNEDADRGAKGSEWNKLMLPIHEQAIDKSWAYSAYVEDNVPIWAHNLGTGANGMYSDADLGTLYNYGDGSYVWQQETTSSNASDRVIRGDGGVSYSFSSTSSNTFAYRGWAPVLELL